MSGNIAIGIQDFSTIIQGNYFFIDKTSFIKEWWDSGDSVTLITRPSRFGKTLAMSMVEQFFSIDYADRSDLFEHLAIWKDDKYRNLQGTYPVISLSFANVKEPTYEMAIQKISLFLSKLYIKHIYILERGILHGADITFFQKMLTATENTNDIDITLALNQLSSFLYQYYGKKVIILLDDYDAPLQEAFINGYWDQMTDFTERLFRSTLKANPYLERAIMIGITSMSKEVIFSDFHNLNIITTTSEKYVDSFGFTEKEVFKQLDIRGLADYKKIVKQWYDGFIFGSHHHIYNPWSIINYLDTKQIRPYWASTSSNRLINKFLKESSENIKKQMEALLNGQIIAVNFNEQMVFEQIDKNENAIWSLLLASGYLKVKKVEYRGKQLELQYHLCITNLENRYVF